MTRLSGLIVNYNTAAYALSCVQSLQAVWELEGRSPGDLELVLIDNASPVDQTEGLARIEAHGVRVIRSERNLGYAGGVNRCYAETSGREDDVVAILNPDLFFIPGSVRTLLDYLAEHRECGVVAPRATIDQEGVVQLPKNPLPGLSETWGVFHSQISEQGLRSYNRARLERALEWWCSDQPISTDMLSGCCLFMRREVVDRMAAPMDERYPLYYEDTDLFRTLQGLGYTVVQHTGTRVVHHWSRSSGVGGMLSLEAQRRRDRSEQLYFRKFYGPLGVLLNDIIIGVGELWPPAWSHRPMHSVEPLGPTETPPEIRLPRDCNYLLELAVTPTWLQAGGIVGSGDRWVCPPHAWEWFFASDYFVRAIDRDTGEFLGAWSFNRTTPGRDRPLRWDEVAHMFPSPIPRPTREVVG